MWNQVATCFPVLWKIWKTVVCFFRHGCLRLQGCRHGVLVSLQPSFTFHSPLGVVEPLIHTYYNNFDSFVLTLTKLIEGNGFVYSFYLRISVTFLSWERSCFTRGKEIVMWKAKEWYIPIGSCQRDYKRNPAILMTQKPPLFFILLAS